MNSRSDLSDLQRSVARLFFRLPESRGFVVAGGAALIASKLVARPTHDIDLFSIDVDSPRVAAAGEAFEDACRREGWTVERVIDQTEFVRLRVSNGVEDLIVDLGRDSPPTQQPRITSLGPTLSDTDLAARKTLALFGRAEGRDFADVFELARRFGPDSLLEWASSEDPGFDTTVFADMLGSLNRLSDDEIPVPPDQVVEVRDFFANWAAALRT